MSKFLKILLLVIALSLAGCATEEEFIYYLGSELQYPQDNKAWTDKYGEVPKNNDYKEFPYGK